MPPFDASWDITLTADGDQTTLVIEVKGMPLDKIAFFGSRLADPRRKPRSQTSPAVNPTTSRHAGKKSVLYQDLAANISSASRQCRSRQGPRETAAR